MFFKRAMDPASFGTHFIGAILSLLGTFIVVAFAISKGAEALTIFSIIVFGLSAVALYCASSGYHYFHGDDLNKIKIRLRKLDHSMIYVLIAGSYTPFSLIYLPKPHAYYFIGGIWLIALMGIGVKLFWLKAPRFLSTLFYLLLGWAIIFDLSNFKAVPQVTMILIALGGIAYSIGAVIYIIKKPNLIEGFGFHEVFHLFVMLGTFFHFLAVYTCLI